MITSRVYQTMPEDHVAYKVSGSALWHHGIIVNHDPACDLELYRFAPLDII
jgi:hypothetical protein